MPIYLIANWKMQLLDSEAASLAAKIAQEDKNVKNGSNIEIILCPSFTALSKISGIIGESKLLTGNCQLSLGAQNVWYYEKGPYTGEISILQLKELGVKYIIIGHSERRKYLGETDEDINRKINICLDNGLTPILCVGETFEERRINKTDLVLIRQISQAMQDVKLKDNQKIIIAYEPVWVIGSGQAIKFEDAQHASQVIKQTLLDFLEPEIIKKNVPVIYGGSVDKDNIKNFIKPKILDGVLVGGASLNIEKFISLIKQLTGD